MKINKIVKSNSDGSKWINITNALLLFKPYNKTKTILWKAPWGLKLCNLRFDFSRYDNNKPWSIKNLRCLVRLPFLYWEKTNGGWEFGLPNLYLWWHKARVIKIKGGV